MFRFYGIIGILMIVFVEANFFLKIQPFANWYFPVVWLGYILVVDAIVYKLRKSSLISNRLNDFLGMLVISSLFWWVFEFINISLGNWSYINADGGQINSTRTLILANLMGSLAFATVLPAFFETVELIRSLHIFDRKRLRKSHKITKRFLISMIATGAACFILPILFPRYAYPLVWASLFFILDPINYLHKQPSIIMHLKDRKLAIPLSLLLAGIIMGFLWEFWNYYAAVKWQYNIPFVGWFKIFEMPVLGYIGYFPFAFELYAMYWFVRSLLLHKEHLLAS